MARKKIASGVMEATISIGAVFCGMTVKDQTSLFFTLMPAILNLAMLACLLVGRILEVVENQT